MASMMSLEREKRQKDLYSRSRKVVEASWFTLRVGSSPLSSALFRRHAMRRLNIKHCFCDPFFISASLFSLQVVPFGTFTLLCFALFCAIHSKKVNNKLFLVELECLVLSQLSKFGSSSGPKYPQFTGQTSQKSGNCSNRTLKSSNRKRGANDN